MAKVRLFYRQVWDENGNLHEIKTTSVEELSNFMKRNGGTVNGYNQGSRMVPESKLQHCIDNVSIEDLMTLKKNEDDKEK